MTKAIKMLSVCMAVILTGCAALCYSASAATTKPHTLQVISKSNFFPAAKNTYYDVSQLEDENGDIFLTFEYKLCAPNMYVINADIDELVWDPSVLEWKNEYNLYGSGRNARVNLFPFLVESGLGSGIINQTSDHRIIGNFSVVQPAAYAYNKDGTAITLIRAVFKLLDKNAETVTVRCDMDTLSYCDDDEPQPESRYSACKYCQISSGYELGTYATQISPPTQAVVGDANADGCVDVRDATEMQRFIAEFDNAAHDLSNPKVFTTLDANHDGRINIKDVTAVQRYAAEMLPVL